MAEASSLGEARRHLSKAEADYRSADGLFHLEEGLALLEEAALDTEPRDRAIAANLLATYSTRICESIRNLVAADRALPEPDLEHLFKVLLAFDAGDLELPQYVRALKIDVVRRLIDRYYEGHPEDEKQQALRQLARLAEEE